MGIMGKDTHIRCAEILSVFFYAVIVIFSITQVVFRYVIGFSIPWTEEVCRYAFIWLVFVAMVIAIRRGEHATIQLVVERFKGKPRMVLFFITLLLTLIFLTVCGFYGIKMIDLARIQSSAALGISLGFVYLSLPVGCLLAIIEILQEMRAVFTGEIDQNFIHEGGAEL
jgi:TRAP-type C4-dicarboxylate transport system permease small subunit